MGSRLPRVWGVLSALALAGAPAPARAQPTAPIYLQYDGFVTNGDGTRTLAFGYFNMNHVDVEIPVGPDNRFTPGPADRQQPVTFLEGRHRFACVMVVPADFDGTLGWQVKYAGATSHLTSKLLDPLYELELNSEQTVMAGLDLTSAPLLTCANKAPVVTLRTGERGDAAAAQALHGDPDGEPEEPTLTGAVGKAVALNASVSDDQLPRGHQVNASWTKVSGPGEVAFGDADDARTTATFSAPGDYELRLDATDGERTGSRTVKVTIAAA